MNKILNLAVVLTALIGLPLAAAEHDHHHQTNSQLTLNNGNKWTIDHSLHLGMTKIKHHIETNLADIHYDRFSAQQYSQLAVALEQELNFIFANCKLAPAADAQLHILLARIMQGSNKIKHQQDKKQGAIAIIQALQVYPKYFADPDWQPLEH